MGAADGAVLAADYGGTLPVIFDDAFSFSDSSRVQDFQRMLDLAVARVFKLLFLPPIPPTVLALAQAK